VRHVYHLPEICICHLTLFATSGKLQGVWLWISVISTLWLWVLGASSFFKQLLFGFSVFDFEAKVFDHL